MIALTKSEKAFFKEFGARLAELRRTQGLTQAEVAHHLGVSQQTVNSFEKGRRRVPVSALPTLARILAVPVEQLVGEQRRPAKRGPTPKLQQQMERISRLPRSKQRLVVEVIEAVLARAAQ